ncbi:hypothetical protein [Lutimonas zeaxanthinifaciens]|uniref:hypothetical protein n=1 Tax=Lutimonas zeaxanthinifaciens TaxID=3060215 RepID=UPI00265CC615|nr:hypothetical protein [Lutimonas sp. YSD2104]WKK64638.1 hypothetical protein QZH61_08545 [Lutimonas sp. YSD2104]
MKIKLILFLVLSIVINGCGKPSYKKNKIIKTKEEVASETSIFDEIPLNQELTAAQQIASATQVVPKAGRDEATVYGYSESGEFMTLREGTNEFVCIANNPKKNGFQIVAYHKSLEPMMSRGRELDSEGKSREEKEEIRSKEAESGKMSLPEAPATLHIYHGADAYFNTETNKIVNGKFRYVVYIPYATQESTGLSLAPNEPGHPWLMFPGQYNAHIMITPEY